MKTLKIIPKFSNEHVAHEFWQNHDSMDSIVWENGS